MHVGSEGTDRGLGAHLARMTDGFSRLVTQHLTLARLELTEDARSAGAQLARVALFVPFLLTGHLLVCAGLALLLGRWMGPWGALVLVGALNLAAGAVGIARAAARLKAHAPLRGTQEELGRSLSALATTTPGARNVVKERLSHGP